jgi:hypothetical protein
MQPLKFSIIQEIKHQGICDASAAIALGENKFVVGNDEADSELGNLLWVYSSQESGTALETIDINLWLKNNPNKKEIDLEGVTVLNDVIYWITSHGRNKKAEQKLPRHQFFASKIKDDGSSIVQFGSSYTQLVLRDIIEDSQLAKIFDFKTAETKAPTAEGGLNIEGLTATPDGNILIGFRNPIPDGKALLLPLKNPKSLVDHSTTAQAEFGDPILLDLEGLGIRSIEFWPALGVYLIIAGEFHGGDQFVFYTWSGKKEDAPEKIESLQFPDGFRPEALLFYPHLKDRFQILSDDGTIKRVDNMPCKEIPDKNNPEKYFRSIWVKVN